jgi:hypothetical protein
LHSNLRDRFTVYSTRNWFAAVFLTVLMTTHAIARPDSLEQQFRNPPGSARPWVYWVWMDGNLSREGITGDLEAMKRAGIGGVIVMEVNVGIPRGPVKFMSDEWREHFKHAVAEAARLGIQIALISGPGWTGSGGPWVTPEQSMQHVVGSSIHVKGPTKFDGTLPRPLRRPAFFGDGKLPPESEKAKDEFYRDIAVLAFPAASRQDTLTDIDEKALYIRAPYSSQPGVRPFIPSPAEYPDSPPGTTLPSARAINISDHLSPDGRLSWDVPEGEWTIFRFGRTSTGANTRPAPLPGVGLECDKLDTAALDAHFNAFIGALIHDVGPRKGSGEGGWTMLHIDSWEMGAQNWTPAFREEFLSRRAYDLLPYLPAVTGAIVDNREASERFLWDLRQTANELVLQNHANRLKQLGCRCGFSLSIEPYDMTPCADMSLGSIADVPMGEFWLYGFNTFHSVIEAASIAHTCGRPVVAAEAFTSLEPERWQAYPGSMKALGDWAFCAGINRLVFHRFQHQPWPGLKPGMTMGPFGVHWEQTQTWWEMVPAYHQYLARCQFMLRRGLPVADVCYLVAEGAPHVFRPPSSATRGNPPDHLGYNFDGCAPEIFMANMSVKDGMLTLPDDMTYHVLVLPERETMTPALLRKVKDLVAAGATVIGPRPRKSPGLSGSPGCDEEVQKLAAEVWGNCDGLRITEHRFGKGRVVWKKDYVDPAEEKAGEPIRGTQYGRFALVAATLGEQGVQEDFSSTPELRYTHRRDEGTEIYFVANPVDSTLSARCIFHVSGKQPELWDPVTAKTRKLTSFQSHDGRTTLDLDFQPHQSFFIIFRKNGATATGTGNFPRLKTVTDISGEWEVAFETSMGGPGEVRFLSLEDWTRRPEEGIKYYSGTAVYRKTFNLAAPLRRSAQGASRRNLWLDLGTVKDLASVRLNGHDLGVLWCAPWRVDIEAFVKGTGNQLEIRVANLWPNRLIGDEKLPPDAEYGKSGALLRVPSWVTGKEPRPSTGRYAFSTWKHFSADSPLLPSGLLGPVRLLQFEK